MEPLPTALRPATAHAWAAAGDPAAPARDRWAPSGSALPKGQRRVWRGRSSDSLVAGTGSTGSMRGAQPAVPGRVAGSPLGRARRRLSAASRSYSGSFSFCCCGCWGTTFPRHKHALRASSAPRRFPSVAAFTRALGPVVPRIIVKCLYGKQINLLCKASHYRLGRLRGVFCTGGRCQAGGEPLHCSRLEGWLSGETRGLVAASPRGDFGTFKARQHPPWRQQ